MGIQITGSNDTIQAADGNLSIEGVSLNFNHENVTGISTMATGHITGTATIDDDLKVGVSTFFVDKSAGKVGIGTDIPGQTLHLLATSGDVYNRIDTNVNGGILIYVQGTQRSVIANDSAFSGTITDTGIGAKGNLIFRAGTSSYDERLRVSSAGKVGINTVSAASQLEVNGGTSYDVATFNSHHANGVLINIQRSGTNIGFIGSGENLHDATGSVDALAVRSQAELTFAAGGGTERLRIRADGRVSIASSLAVTGITTAAAFVPTGAEQQFSHRNIWINGSARVAQKGTSIASLTSSGGYVNGGPDRTYVGMNNHGTWTLAQGTDAPPGFVNCVEWTATTGDGSVAADAAIRWWQRWEGRDMQRFMKGTSSAKEFALSFWVKSATTGDYAIELLDYDNSNRGVTRTYTINAADTWEYKKVILPADTTGAFDNDSSPSFACEFWIVAGSNYTSGGADASWHSYADNKRAGGHTANAGASNNDYHRVTGIQLEAGSYCTPYEHKSYAEELRACRRYYYRETIANNDFFTGMGMADVDGNSVILNLSLPVEMRQEPTLDTSGTAGDYMIRRSTTQTCTSVPTINGASTPHQAAVVFTKSSHGFGDGSAVRCGSKGSGYLGFSAEV